MTVTNTTGGNYDNTAYNNILFTSSGTEANQKWSGGTVKLSATDGYCYAYYPYSPSASTFTSIPVTAGGIDYMYATPVTVNDKDREATLNMKHALATIRFALKKGTYAGTGAVTAVSVASSALGSTGTLNAKTGDVTAASLGTAVSQTASFNLETTAKNVDVLMVPSGNAGTITLSVTIDGQVYSTEVTSTTIKQGSCYTYRITVDAGSLALSGVKVGDWGYSDNGTPTITAGGYTVTIDGDYSDISFSNSVSGNSVIIVACSMGDEKPKKVSVSGSATTTQSVDIEKKRRTITLSNINSDVTIICNGLGSNWDTVTEDGVYYIGDDGDYTATASSSCIGVALINTDKNQRLMIEKYENATNTESTTIYTKEAQILGSSNTDKFSWGGYGTDQSGITSYTKVDGSNSDGVLDLSNSGLNIDPSTWASGALSDFDSKSHSEVIKNITTNGTQTSVTTAPMAYLLNAFNASDCPASVCQGFHDWYVPSCGQLGLIWLNLKAINKALTAIGGTTLSKNFYWSSSECNYNFGWSVRLYDGNVCTFGKYSSNRLRLVRNL